MGCNPIYASKKDYRRAVKRTEREMQARMDALYGDGIFRVCWPEGSTVIYVDLIDKSKLVKRLMD